MPKMKTRRSVAKRFKLTASGKLKRKSANLRHILEKKSQSRKREARKTEYVHKADMPRIKRCLPYGS